MAGSSRASRSTRNLKRDSDALDIIDLVQDDRPLKRKCLTFIDEDDMDWLKVEISSIKECMREIENMTRMWILNK